MGNIIGSGDEDLDLYKYNHLKLQKSQSTKGLTHTATGRYSTPNLKKKSTGDAKANKKENTSNKNKEFNFKIFQEIFPPVSTTAHMRNTIAPASFKISEREEKK